MGCLNSKGQFSHWFGNIHLSGPCNRECYFCIGQHMMALDKYNTLDKWPLIGLDSFIEKCQAKGVHEINMTGSNTDPMLFKHTQKLKSYLLDHIPDFRFKIRTNAVKKNLDLLKLYDSGSVTICSFDPEIYKQMMGKGSPPDLDRLLEATSHWPDLKINIVLGPENIQNGDFLKTLEILSENNIPKVNIREPYGQPRVGNPLANRKQAGTILGNPYYVFRDTKVAYWDVHYTEVESINLYANGRVSDTYPITKGHHATKGLVLDQSHFTQGRQREQWLSFKNKQKDVLLT